MRRVALPLLAWALVTGCRTLPEAVVPLPPADPRPAALLQGLRTQEEGRRAVRASARVSLSGQRGASFARQLLLLERPARLRVEVLGLLGQRVAVLATDGGRYELYRAETGSVESGEIHPAILFEIAGVPLTPEQAVALLLGGPGGAPSAARAFERGEGTIRLEWPGSGSRFEHALDFDEVGHPRRYAVGTGSGAPLLEVLWNDYRDVGGSLFAHRVELDFPRTDAHAEVSFRSVELNPSLPDALFRLDLAGREVSAWGVDP